MTTSTESVFKTTADDVIVYEGASLEDAIRSWDHATYDKARVVVGGIEMKGTTPSGLIVRDAWLLHVNEDGVVYLSPHLYIIGA